MSDKIAPEPIIEPDLPIVDPHHHLWYHRVPAQTDTNQAAPNQELSKFTRLYGRYLFDELLADVTAGHNVRATVFVEAHAMYKATGPEAMRSLGEVEFVNGMAAIAESGAFGDVKICAGIVGAADLRLGDGIKPVLEAHLQAGGGRYRGIRAPGIAYDPALEALGYALEGTPHLFADATVRAAVKHLEALGLSLDVWIFDAQLPDLIDLARAFPRLQIILNHVAMPLGIGPYAGKQQERFPTWRDDIRTLSQSANVAVKLGGLGMPFCGLPSSLSTTPAGSEQLAAEWRPYIETCIEAFGADRCMFESNFPVDGLTASYPAIWNAFKRIAGKASPEEKTALFSGTATRWYRLAL